MRVREARGSGADAPHTSGGAIRVSLSARRPAPRTVEGSDPALAARVWDAVEAEYARTRETILRVTGHAELMDGDPVIQRSVALRNPYVDPLNYLQVEMIKRRRARRVKKEDREGIRAVLELTVNGIAGGLKNTG